VDWSVRWNGPHIYILNFYIDSETTERGVVRIRNMDNDSIGQKKIKLEAIMVYMFSMYPGTMEIINVDLENVTL